MHVWTLLYIFMGEYQISCGDIEMAKPKPKSDPKNLN